MDVINYISTEGVSELISKIKSAFIKKTDSTEVSSVDVDQVPTSGSTNLVTSGGVFTAIKDITTFNGVPSGMSSYKSGTLAAYCQQFTTLVAPKTGSGYLDSGITFTDLPKSFKDSGSAGCEIYIYIPYAGYSGSTHNVIYIIEITTTNCYSKQWNDSPGKFMAIYQDETGHQKLHMNWQGMMGCPQSDNLITKDGVSEHKFIPTKDYHAASKYYVDLVADGKQSLISSLSAADKKQLIHDLNLYTEDTVTDWSGYTGDADIVYVLNS